MLQEKKTLDPQQAFQCLIKLQERRVALVEAVEKIDLSQSADFARTYYKLAQKFRRLREVNVAAEKLLSGDP
jgi:hypothetical protein